MDDTSNKNAIPDIEDLHQQALREGSKTYIDPETGFTVFTELLHLERGFCCGNSCRHCPFGHENVDPAKQRRRRQRQNGNIRPSSSTITPPVSTVKVRSGDTETTQRMVAEIMGKQKSTSKLSCKDGSNSTTTSNSSSKSTKNVPYTRGGDKGTSQLGTGERRSKDDANFEALGSVDELCTFVGVAHAHLIRDSPCTNNYGELPDQLLDVMSRLFDVGSHVAKPNSRGDDDDGKFSNKNGLGDGFDSCHIDDLEIWINDMTEQMPELTSFILPTGSVTAAHLHVARTVCRRAERRCVTLVVDHETCDPNALKYLNRLSDYLFTASRYVNFCENQPEIQYVRPSKSSTQRQRVSRSLKQEEK